MCNTQDIAWHIISTHGLVALIFNSPKSLASRILHPQFEATTNVANKPPRNFTSSVSLTGKENFNSLKATKIFRTRQLPYWLCLSETVQNGAANGEFMHQQLSLLSLRVRAGSLLLKVRGPVGIPKNPGKNSKPSQSTGWHGGKWSESPSLKTRKGAGNSPQCHVRTDFCKTASEAPLP